MDILSQALVLLAILAVGHLFVRFGIFGDKAPGIVSNIVLTVSLPFAVVHAFAVSHEVVPQRAAVFLAAGFAATIVPALLSTAWCLARRLPFPRRALALFTCTGFNIGVFGMPVTCALVGPREVAATMVFFLGSECAFALVAAASAAPGQPRKVLAPFARLLRSIPVVATLASLAVCACGFPFAGYVAEFTAPGSQANPFLSMLMLGMALSPARTRKDFWRDLSGILPRLALSAGVAAVLWHTLPLAGWARIITCALVFSPMTQLAPFHVYRLGADGAAAAARAAVSVPVALAAMAAACILLRGVAA